MSANDNERFTIRELTVDDAGAFRAIRLDALRTEENRFAASYQNEVALPHHEWEKRIEPTPDKRYFGLFNTGIIIGTMYAMRWDEDTSGQSALWGFAYIRPEYRGQHISSGLYAAREDWTTGHPRFTSAVMFIKQDNARSAGIHLRHGAEYMFSRELNFPNRPNETWDFYRRPLQKAMQANAA